MNLLSSILAISLLSSSTQVSVPKMVEVSESFFYHKGQKFYFQSLDPSKSISDKVNTQTQFLNHRIQTLKLNSLQAHPISFGENAIALLTNHIVIKLKKSEYLPLILAELEGYSKAQEFRGLDNVYTIEFFTYYQALTASQKLGSHTLVEYAHPDFILAPEPRNVDSSDFNSSGFDPNGDLFFMNQWHLSNTGQMGGQIGIDVNAVPAWEHSIGANRKPLVAVIDFGFEQEHPDLKDIWYINTGEIAGNGIDDDGNGKIDDVSGWNFSINGNNLVYGASTSHGTSVAGLVASRANGTGIVGSCPMCRVLPIVISGRASEDAQSFLYSLERGAEVITNSWGYAIGTPSTQVLEEAIKKAALEGRGGKGTSILFAMNNYNIDDCRGTSPDISAHPNVIAISSIDSKGRRVRSSGYGACLKFVSPSHHPNITDAAGLVATDRVGSKGYNTGSISGELPNLDYTNKFGGTSGATPIASGVFALMYDLKPELSHAEALKILQNTARKINPQEANYNSTTGHSTSYGFGLVDFGKALSALVETE